MKRVRLNDTAPTAYFERARKQDLGHRIVETSDSHADFLVGKGYATLIKTLPKKTGINKPLKFGDKFMIENIKLIYLYPVIGGHQFIDKKGQLLEFTVRDLKRGWKE